MFFFIEILFGNNFKGTQDRPTSSIDHRILAFQDLQTLILEANFEKISREGSARIRSAPGYISQVYISGNLYFSLSVYLSFYLSP